MASGDEAVKIVDPADLANDGPMVSVDSVEKESFFSFLKASKKEADNNGATKPDAAKPAPGTEKKENEASTEHKGKVHDGDGIKSTYDVEEDVPPSLVEQLKRKVHWNGR